MPKTPVDFSKADQAAIQAVLRYWIAKWDWECPTLFGIEKEQVQQVLNLWPESVGNKEVVALAINGALREFLHGASAVHRSQVAGVCGLSYEEASNLSKRFSESVDHAV